VFLCVCLAQRALVRGGGAGCSRARDPSKPTWTSSGERLRVARSSGGGSTLAARRHPEASEPLPAAAHPFGLHRFLLPGK